MQIVDVYPLELAFQDPRPSFIDLVPEGMYGKSIKPYTFIGIYLRKRDNVELTKFSWHQ